MKNSYQVGRGVPRTLGLETKVVVTRGVMMIEGGGGWIRGRWILGQN
jgi:hypothetical protein